MFCPFRDKSNKLGVNCVECKIYVRSYKGIAGGCPFKILGLFFLKKINEMDREKEK